MKTQKWILIDNFNQIVLKFYTLKELKEYAKSRGWKAKHAYGVHEYTYYLDNAF